MEELKREVNNEGRASEDTSRPTYMSGEMTTGNEREQERGHSTSWEVEQLTDGEWRSERRNASVAKGEQKSLKQKLKG